MYTGFFDEGGEGVTLRILKLQNHTILSMP